MSNIITVSYNKKNGGFKINKYTADRWSDHRTRVKDLRKNIKSLGIEFSFELDLKVPASPWSDYRFLDEKVFIGFNTPCFGEAESGFLLKILHHLRVQHLPSNCIGVRWYGSCPEGPQIHGPLTRNVDDLLKYEVKHRSVEIFGVES